MKTALDVLTLSSDFLKQKGVVSPRRIAEHLLEAVLGVSRIELYMQSDRPLNEGELSRYRGFIQRAAKHEPWAYIVGEVEFFDCLIAVTPDVLIPRQETEIMLDLVCGRLKEDKLEGKVALDLCCGSGCLGIGLKKALPQLDVIASDLSKEALEVASENAKRNQADLKFLQGDLLVPLGKQKIDYLLCNPPYISQAEYEELDLSVKGYEPQLALVGGASGMEYYTRLEEVLPEVLNPKARLFFEIGEMQGEMIQEVFSHHKWKNQEIRQDFSGKDRFFFLEYC